MNRRRSNGAVWVIAFLTVILIAAIGIILIVGNNSGSNPDVNPTPTPTATPSGTDDPSDPSKVHVLMDTTSWLNGLETRLRGYESKGHTWAKKYHMVSGNIEMDRSALAENDTGRCNSSITENRKPKAWIDDAPEFSVPSQSQIVIKDNMIEARDYIFCKIIADPIYGDMIIQHLDENAIVKTSDGRTVSIVQNDTILRAYLNWANAAYSNSSRQNFTGYISTEWVQKGWSPYGWEAMRSPYNNYISHEVNYQTGRYDYESMAVHLCQLLEQWEWADVGDQTFKVSHHLVRINNDPARRTELKTESVSGRWIRVKTTQYGSEQKFFIRTGDLRIAHPVGVNPTKPPVVTTPPPEVTPTPTAPPEITPTPTPTGEVTPTPTPTGEVTPTPTPTGEVTPTPTPTGEVTPTPTPTPTDEPTPTPTDEPTPTPTQEPTPTPTKEPTPTPTQEPTPTPSPTPHKEEEEKPDEQGHAPEGGGHNDDDGPGPAEPTPMVATPAPGESGEYQPQADPTPTPKPSPTPAPATASPTPVIHEQTPAPTADQTTPDPDAGTADDNTGGGDVWTPD